MRYVKETPFVDWRGKEVVADIFDGRGEQALTTGSLLMSVAGLLPTAVGDNPLKTTHEVRALQRALDVLEAVHTHGWWVFESEDFAALEKVVKALAPKIPKLLMHTPQIEEFMASASSRMPDGLLLDKSGLVVAKGAV